MAERVAETKFPWLMSNVIDNETGRPLGDGKITHVMDWNGKRIGLVKLIYIIIFNLFEMFIYGNYSYRVFPT